jgi:hypothetical protein
MAPPKAVQVLMVPKLNIEKLAFIFPVYFNPLKLSARSSIIIN